MFTRIAEQPLRDKRGAAGRRLPAILALALGMTPCGRCCAGEGREWTLSPYRVQCAVAVDARVRPQAGLEAELVQFLAERVEAVVSPLWQLQLHAATEAGVRRQCFDPVEIAPDGLSAEQEGFDKLFWLGVRARPEGFELTCREYDAYLGRWGAAQRRLAPQSSFLKEACFQILMDAFAPLATIDVAPEDAAHVRLIFKGSELPLRNAGDLLAQSGEAFQPMVRRTDRTGELLKNGIAEVPWTYLTASERAAALDAADGGAVIWQARVHSGMRRPFAVQRRGLVQQVAIALRYSRGPSRVRFHARTDKEQSLAGYEVYRAADDGPAALVGKTDRQGMIIVPAGEQAITTLLLRSEGQLLAKVPVPAGMPDVLEAPIADSIARLRAQAEVQVVREELIDVVARRAIMMTRVRSLLKKGRVDDARKLMMELDELPTSSTFGRTIEQAAKRIPPSGDPTVQRTIEKLFSSTRELLSKFLNPRPVIDLQGEVNSASAAPPPPAPAGTRRGTRRR
ncbi:MAG: hypothetical protein IT424_13155, partial [Pirellulales bacterium]|nr:hypothetical protein [Pirellulales bacterium]